jgi:hypothetical protein
MNPLCDFCAAQPVTAWFPTEQASLVALAVRADPEDPKAEDVALAIGSQGSWAACRECEALVMSLNAVELLRRAIAGAIENAPQETKDLIQREIGETFWNDFVGRYLQGFWSTWTGKSVHPTTPAQIGGNHEVVND